MKADSIEPSVLVKGAIPFKQATNTTHLRNLLIPTNVSEKIVDTLADLGSLIFVNCDTAGSWPPQRVPSASYLAERPEINRASCKPDVQKPTSAHDGLARNVSKVDVGCNLAMSLRLMKTQLP